MPTATPKCRSWFRTPAWLQALDDLERLPLRSLLKDSLFYPASGCDGGPVQALGGFIHSFIYVDYAISKDDVLADIRGERHGFKGYRLAMCRGIEASELVSPSWQPSPLLPEDGHSPPHAFQSYMPAPFALWAIFDRQPDLDDRHGPARFSLLHICGDGAATYEALYNRQKIQPDVLAIIRPGTGYGLNWTDFRDARQVLGRMVFRNPAGKPRYLLQEANGDDGAYWPGYRRKLDEWPSAAGGALPCRRCCSSWRRKRPCCC